MNKNFSYYLSKYLKDYLILERNLSKHTIRSYKNTFQILIEYLVSQKHFTLQQITFENITRDLIVEFLDYLENVKHNTTRTRNQRLNAIKAFYQYCAIDEIENINSINKILSIKNKKFAKKIIDYLTEDELKQVFDSIDTTTKIGRRDLTIVTLMYDTGARASEILELKYEDINLEEQKIILTGKGNKKRIVPIMNPTKDLLIKYFKESNIRGGSIVDDSAGYELIRYIFKKINKLFLNKNITPHTLRHTRAVHLLDNGVPLIYIKELFGHASIVTTEEYAKIIEKRKFEAIENAMPKIASESILSDWNDDIDLLSQLLIL